MGWIRKDQFGVFAICNGAKNRPLESLELSLAYWGLEIADYSWINGKLDHSIFTEATRNVPVKNIDATPKILVNNNEYWISDPVEPRVWNSKRDFMQLLATAYVNRQVRLSGKMLQNGQPYRMATADIMNQLKDDMRWNRYENFNWGQDILQG